jgi:hypothetical protein
MMPEASNSNIHDNIHGNEEAKYFNTSGVEEKIWVAEFIKYFY